MYSTTVCSRLILKCATCLNDFLELFIAISNMLEELLVNFCQLCSHLGCKFVFVDLFYLWLLKLLSLSFGGVKVLFSFKFALKDCSHDFLLTRVQSLIIKCAAH